MASSKAQEQVEAAAEPELNVFEEAEDVPVAGGGVKEEKVGTPTEEAEVVVHEEEEEEVAEKEEEEEVKTQKEEENDEGKEIASPPSPIIEEDAADATFDQDEADDEDF